MDAEDQKAVERCWNPFNPEEMYRVLFEESPYGMFVANTEGMLIAVNREFSKLTGYSGKELPGMNIAELIPPGDQALDMNPMKDHLPGRVSAKKLRLLCIDGRYIWVETRIRILSEGHLIGIVTDIEGSVQTEVLPHRRMDKPEERKETEDIRARLNAILERTSDLVATFIPGGNLTYINQAGRKMAGWSSEESLEGKAHIDLHPEWAVRKIQSEALPEASEKGLWEGETAIINRDGLEIPVSQVIVAHRSADGKLDYLSTIMRDISERKRAEEEQENTLALLRASITESPSGILIAEAPDVKIRWANPAAFGIRGRTSLPLTDIEVNRHASHWQTFRPDGTPFPPEELPLSRATLKGEIIRGEEVIIRNSQGDDRWVLANAAPIRNREGSVTSGIVVFHDITDRKKAEIALYESESRFRMLAEKAPFGLSLMRPDLTFEYLNPFFTEIFGYNIEDLPNKKVWFTTAYPDPEYRELVAQRWYTDIGTGSHKGRSADRIFRVRCKNGQDKVIHFRSAVFDDGRHLMTYEDITERVSAEEALRRSDELSSKLISAIPDLVVRTDINGTVQFINDIVLQVSGYDKSEVIGKSMISFIAPEDHEKAIRNTLLMMTKRLGPVEYRMLLKDGTRRLFEVNGDVLRTEDKMPYSLVYVLRDITERKRAAEAIKLNEARLECLLRINEHPADSIQELLDFSLNEAIALTGSKIGYVYFYDEAKKEFTLNTWSADVMRQCSVNDAQSVYQLEQTGIWGEAVRQGKPVIVNDFAAPNPLKKGLPPGHAPLHNFLTIPVFSQGRIVAVVGVANKDDDYNDSDVRQLTLMMDAVWKIVQRKKIEEEKEKLQAQLLQAQKMESVGRLAGGVAHDFNNMLGAIIGNAELGMLSVKQTDPIYINLKDIKRAAQRSAELTRQLLAFARKQTIAPKVLDLNATVKNMLTMIQRLIGEDIELLWKPGAGIWPVKLDPSQIDQVLVNLCVNARDAIDGVGKLTIETGKTFFDEAYCSVHPGFHCGEYVMLAVSDDGSGMDKETLSNIFDPFFTTKEVGKGTGLGLATVYGIVKQNEGLINVYSEPGKGSTFKIYLPRFLGEPIDSTSEGTMLPLRGRGETVLLVEDDENILKVSEDMLKELGYMVIAAGTPSEALRHVREQAGRIQLLISDVVMPQMNGRDLVKSARSITPGIRCVFMSGYTANVIAHNGILDEGVLFIQKPFSMRDLAAKVREALE